MEGNVVSSGLTAFQTNDKYKVNCRRWNDDLRSNITYTKPWYRAEIKKLKGEISKLEANLKEDKQTFSTVGFNDILSKLIDKLSKDKQASLEGLDIKGKLNEDGDIDIKRLERFTGLCIHDISLTLQEGKKDSCVYRKHHVHGSCRNVEFETAFLVEENTNENDLLPGNEDSCGNLPRVISLDVSIEKEDVNSDLKDFLEYVQEEKKLQQFFVTLQNYSKWKRDRSKTFHHFQARYPELVAYTPFRDESTMAICNQQHPHLRVNIVWKVLVAREGKIKPSFDLQSCVPIEQMDSKSFLRKIRSKFLCLLKSLGIEKSIEVIILSMAK